MKTFSSIVKLVAKIFSAPMGKGRRERVLTLCCASPEREPSPTRRSRDDQSTEVCRAAAFVGA
jgi:hypothetical protein